MTQFELSLVVITLSYQLDLINRPNNFLVLSLAKEILIKLSTFLTNNALLKIVRMNMKSIFMKIRTKLGNNHHWNGGWKIFNNNDGLGYHIWQLIFYQCLP